MSIITCTRCGKSFEDTSNSCPNCGNTVRQIRQDDDIKKAKKDLVNRLPDWLKNK